MVPFSVKTPRSILQSVGKSFARFDLNTESFSKSGSTGIRVGRSCVLGGSVPTAQLLFLMLGLCASSVPASHRTVVALGVPLVALLRFPGGCSVAEGGTPRE